MLVQQAHGPIRVMRLANRRRLMIADTLHRCRGNSEYRNRHVRQESADIADTCAGII
jgi:hypothetical protein